MNKTFQSTLLGAAGEHYVLSELLRRGYIAALAPQGVPNTDIVVTDLLGSRLCAIQVKTRRDIGSDGGWHMKDKHETVVGDRLFYCFVDYGRSIETRPTVSIIPSAIVAEVLAKSHQAWLNKPGKMGQPHTDGPMRRLMPDYTRIFGDKDNPYPAGWLDNYRDAWNLLGLDCSAESDNAGKEMIADKASLTRRR